MSDIAIKVEDLSKQYRLGTIGTGTLSHDLNRAWASIRGRKDPYAMVGDTNDRRKTGGSDYVWALEDINFEVKRGEVLGIIGRNGAGKSTLLKILSKVTTPSTGSVKMNGRVGSLLEVGTGFHPELTGRENIYINGAILGMRKWEIDKKLDEIVNFSGVEKYLDTPVKRYSSGMKVRLGFAVAAHLEPEILIVDEVLAVGDAEFQKKCLGKMGDISKNEGRTILFVSHNLGSIKALCPKVLVLDSGKIAYRGNTDHAIREYYNMLSTLSDTISIKSINNDIIQVKGLSILDKNSAAIESLSSGESYQFKLNCKAFSPVTNLRVMLKITDFDGRVYLTLSNYWYGNHFNMSAGHGYVLFKIVNLPLAEGEYIAKVEFKADGVHIRDIDILKFRVILTSFYPLGKRSLQGHGVLVDHSVIYKSEPLNE
jgi:lipopolysaccharide transport system ATP-binding protein